LRVARKHAPHLVKTINEMPGGSIDEIIASAKTAEDTRNWSKAIDLYIEIRTDNCPDVNVCVKCLLCLLFEDLMLGASCLPCRDIHKGTIIKYSENRRKKTQRS